MAKRKSIPDADTSERILPVEEVLARIPLDRSTLWRMSNEGRFPKPIQLTPSRIGWRWSAILDWLADREANPVEARAYYRKPKKTAADAEARVT